MARARKEKTLIDIDKVRALWHNVRRNMTTENLKLIKAVEELEDYLF